MLAPDVGTSQIASVASAPEAAPVLGEQRGFLRSFLGSCPLLQEIQLSALQSKWAFFLDWCRLESLSELHASASRDS